MQSVVYLVALMIAWCDYSGCYNLAGVLHKVTGVYLILINHM